MATPANLPGDGTRATLAQVAARAGVSASTASLAFSGAGPVADETRERVLAAARELDYGGPDPRARSLRTGRSGIIAVVMEDRIRVAFRDPMVVTLLDGIADEIGNAGYSLLLLTDSLERAEGGLRDAPMDAALLLGCSTDLDPAVRVLSQRQVPLIGVEAEPRQGLPMVDIDNRAGMRRLAEHFAELGHERVAVITLPMDRDHTRGPLTQVWQDSSVAYTGLERLSGVRDVFPDAPAVVAAGSLIEEGLIAARALLDAEPGLTAIVGQSDLLALGAIQAAEERGLRVPQDISIAGFDGARIDGLSRHRLTTVVQPSVEKGRAAARLALAALAGEPVENIAFTTELRIGDTTASPRRG
ncbi:substrate-binding domain-containing protein [Microcella alkalica]|uniref:DNA-binding LacI/PurR family transcriptional regulator n=1 Tax=Microcella alkalica TaxID=355930 RepID=A0A839EEB9_9MICO|nr:LacI family DNA-binding transcriptional regulator [Microcella alkalica]MBA8848584.1 DNA-binding LacI/PurR family transcriptional regulator [Microcella alkalica]